MKKFHLLDAFLLFLVVASGSASASLVEYQIQGTVGVVDTPLQGEQSMSVMLLQDHSQPKQILLMMARALLYIQPVILYLTLVTTTQ